MYIHVTNSEATIDSNIQEDEEGRNLQQYNKAALKDGKYHLQPFAVTGQ